jgi:hypothetical protein
MRHVMPAVVRKQRLVGSLLLLLVTIAAHADEFARYPSERPLRGIPVPPRLNTPKAHHYRTILRDAAKKGPNFNGHYRIVDWGCGTNCIEWAVINLETGEIRFAPKPAFSCWAPDELGNAKVPDWFDARMNSSLFYLHTCDPAFEGPHTFNKRRIYVWDKSGPRLLRVEPIQY